MKKIFGGTETKIVRYVEETFRPEDQALKDARERMKKGSLPAIQVGKMDSLHLEVLTRACGAKKAVEIGTLGGYSGICIARGLSPNGKLFTLELKPEHAELARENFLAAGVASFVEILVGPAIENLNKITSEGPFDLVFIDADKPSYPAYLQWATENLRIGGLLLADNTLGWGLIAEDQFETEEDEKAILALRDLNLKMSQEGRFRATLLPTGEGMTAGVKIR